MDGEGEERRNKKARRSISHDRFKHRTQQQQHREAEPANMSTHHSNSNDHHEGHVDQHDHGGHHGDHHHGHFVVPKFTLRLIFGLLISLTILTVAAAQFEVAIASFFGFQIPGIVNVLIALSIATVKTTLVVMFFMQLRYDNPLNTMVFIFTIFTVAFFLGFTMIDLGNRGSVDRFKAAISGRAGTLRWARTSTLRWSGCRTSSTSCGVQPR